MVSSLLFSVIIYPILFIFPAYAANGIPVLLGGGPPLDFGRKFRGVRILGDNKTIRGTIVAVLAGLIAGYIESWSLTPAIFPTFVALTLGAVFGDLFGSFVKRQLRFKPGSSFAFMDQYGFFFFSLVFAYPVGAVFFPSLYGLIFIVVITGIVHVGANIGAYKAGLKKVPW